MTNDIRGKTGRYSVEELKAKFPLLSQNFKKTFFLRTEKGEALQIPYGVIDSVIGYGGFGAVYRLLFNKDHPWRTQYNLGTYGAVKILSNRDDHELLKRFEREGRIGLALKSKQEGGPDSLLTVVESGELEDENKKGERYILMEYLENAEELSDYVLTDPDNPEKGEKLPKRLPIEEALAVISTLVEAVDYAHGKGITHRDIKPSNLIRDRKNKSRIKLIDFGMGTIKGLEAELYAGVKEDKEATVAELTENSQLFRGTIHYASPESALGHLREHGKEIDVWGVGATAYALLAGVPPFPGPIRNPAERAGILTQIVLRDEEEHYVDNVPFLNKRNPNVPLPINDWVMSCLEKNLVEPEITPGVRTGFRTRSENLKARFEEALDEVGYKRAV